MSEAVFKKPIRSITVGLIVLLIVSVGANVLFYSDNGVLRDHIIVLDSDKAALQDQVNALQIEKMALEDQVSSLQQNYDALNSSYKSLLNGYNSLDANYSSLQIDYEGLQTDYERLQVDYEGAIKVPHIQIRNGTIYWRFKLLNGELFTWWMSIEEYKYYLNKTKPVDCHLLETVSGLVRIRKYELLVQPEVFCDLSRRDLTEGNTDREFVEEVFNFMKQLTMYHSDVGEDYPKWPLETLAEGAGDCEDFAILAASLLKAGDEYAGYGMSFQMVYMDAYNPTDPQEVNHVCLYITYSDGSTQFFDATSDVISPWAYVVGWYFNI